MAYSDFTKQEYSTQDFLRLLEHRVRKDIRIHNLINPKETYVLKDDGLATTALLKHFIEKIFHKRIEFSDSGIVLSSDVMENYIANHLDVFLEGKDFSLFTTEVLFPLRTITQAEAKQAIELLGLPGEFKETNHEFVEALQKKYSQTKASFLKSFLNIGEELSKAE